MMEGADEKNRGRGFVRKLAFRVALFASKLSRRREVALRGPWPPNALLFQIA